jgi:hypothetical protein
MNRSPDLPIATPPSFREWKNAGSEADERTSRPAASAFPVRHGRAEIFTSAAQLPPQAWQRALAGDAKDWR